MDKESLDMIDPGQIKRTGITYPSRFVPIKFTCECGAQCRLDCEAPKAGFVAAQPYQHCARDKGRSVSLPIALWEERNGKWILAEKLR